MTRKSEPRPAATGASTSRPAAWCDQLIEACWLLALVIAALFFNPYAEDAFESGRGLLVRGLAVVMATAGILSAVEIVRWQGTGALARRLRAASRRPLVVPAVLFAAAVMASTATSLEPDQSWWGVLPRLQGAYGTLAWVAIFVLAAPRMGGYARQQRWLATLMLVSAALSIYGVAQWLGWDPLSWGGAVEGRVIANQGNPIFLGAFLAMAAPFALARSLLASGHRHRLGVVVWAALFALLTSGLLLTRSRGPAIALVAGLVLFALAAGLALGHRRRVLTAGLAGAGLAAVTLLVVLAGGGIGDRLGMIAAPESGTAGQRFLTWQATIELLLDAPERSLLGFGPEMMATVFPRYVPAELPGLRWHPDLYQDRAHNAVLDRLVTGGLVGTGLYLLILGSALATTLARLGLVPDARWRRGLAAALIMTPALGAAAAWLASPGHGLVGVAAGAGLIAGTVFYLLAVASFGPEIRQPDRERALLGAAILGAVTAHVLEIQVGIAVTSTSIAFWMLAAWLAAGGPARRRLEDRRRPPAAGPLVPSAGLLIGLILATFSFALWTPAQHLEGNRTASFAVVLIAVSSACGLILTAAGRRVAGRSAMVAAAWCLPYLALHTWLTTGEATPETVVRCYLLQLVAGGVVLAWRIGDTAGSGKRHARDGSMKLPVGYLAGYAALAAALLIAPTTSNLAWLRAGLSMKAGREAFASGRFDLASTRFEDAVGRAPAADQHHLALARARIRHAAVPGEHRRRQRLEAIAADLEQLRRRRPRNVDVLVELGYLHSRWSGFESSAENRREHLRRASAWYNKAAEAAPSSAPIQRGWGAVLLDLGELEGAVERLERAAKLSPRSTEGHLVLGRARLERGDLEPAREAFARAAEVDAERAWQVIGGVARARPGDWRGHRDLALMFAVTGQREEARAALGNALKLSPASHPVLEELWLELAGEAREL